MSLISTAREIGSLVDPDMIKRAQLTPDHLYGVVGCLQENGVQRFEQDLRIFKQHGRVSDLLLGILAIAGGKRSPRDGSTIIIDLQPNVVGLVFRSSAEARAQIVRH